MMRKPLGYHPPTFSLLRCNAVFYFCTGMRNVERSSKSAPGVHEMPSVQNYSDPETARVGLGTEGTPADRDLKER